MSLELVRSEILSNNFRLTNHARLRMSERNVTRQDIAECVLNGLGFSDGDKFKFVGYDTEGVKLKVVCVYIETVLIVNPESLRTKEPEIESLRKDLESAYIAICKERESTSVSPERLS